MEKICQACGAKLTKEAKFCNECGMKYEPPAKPETKLVSAVLVRKMVYTIDEAAKALGISVGYMNKLIARKEITVCRQGRKVGFTEWALEEYSKAHEVVPEHYLRGELEVL
jgi:excisionase family DNA binding protein